MYCNCLGGFENDRLIATPCASEVLFGFSELSANVLKQVRWRPGGQHTSIRCVRQVVGRICLPELEHIRPVKARHLLDSVFEFVIGEICLGLFKCQGMLVEGDVLTAGIKPNGR
jgi:hypothetical protein